jgi:anti-sigma factor RsiW
MKHGQCEHLDPLFAPYVDGEVASSDRAAIDAHLAKCPPCRDRVAEQRTMCRVLAARRSTLRPCAPADLRDRCAAHAAAAKAGGFPGRAVFSKKWVPFSVAATIALAVAGVFLFSPNNKVEALAAQLTVDHMTCFQFAPERLHHADAPAAEREWMVKQHWGIHVPASSATNELELLGVRRCGMSSGRVAHILYKWRGKPLSVFVVPRTMPAALPREAVDKFGHEAVMWSDRNRTYVILARGRRADLAPVVGYVKAHAY